MKLDFLIRGCSVLAAVVFLMLLVNPMTRGYVYRRMRLLPDAESYRPTLGSRGAVEVVDNEYSGGSPLQAVSYALDIRTDLPNRARADAILRSAQKAKSKVVYAVGLSYALQSAPDDESLFAWRKTLSSAKEASVLEPKNAFFWLVRSVCEQSLGRDDLARQYLQTASTCPYFEDYFGDHVKVQLASAQDSYPAALVPSEVAAISMSIPIGHFSQFRKLPDLAKDLPSTRDQLQIVDQFYKVGLMIEKRDDLYRLVAGSLLYRAALVIVGPDKKEPYLADRTGIWKRMEKFSDVSPRPMSEYSKLSAYTPNTTGYDFIEQPSRAAEAGEGASRVLIFLLEIAFMLWIATQIDAEPKSLAIILSVVLAAGFLTDSIPTTALLIAIFGILLFYCFLLFRMTAHKNLLRNVAVLALGMGVAMFASGLLPWPALSLLVGAIAIPLLLQSQFRPASVKWLWPIAALIMVSATLYPIFDWGSESFQTRADAFIDIGSGFQKFYPFALPCGLFLFALFMAVGKLNVRDTSKLFLRTIPLCALVSVCLFAYGAIQWTRLQTMWSKEIEKMPFYYAAVKPNPTPNAAQAQP